MRALAYASSGYSCELAEAFANGCRRYGVTCEVRLLEQFKGPEPCEVVWLFGLIAMARVFDAYRGRALRITGDLGYWRERASALSIKNRPVRIAVEAQQPDAHLRLHLHSPDRFWMLNLGISPVFERGAYILVTGHCAEQARYLGYAYGEWEAKTVVAVRRLTDRPIVVREKPSSDPLRIDGTTRDSSSAADAIRNAWAVVCCTGNIGADAILHGVPVFAQSGPGAVYYRAPLESIEQARPLDAYRRIGALADLAYWQYSLEEFERGALWSHLLLEGVLS